MSNIQAPPVPIAPGSAAIDAARPVDLYRSAKALEELEARIALRESELNSLKSELENLKVATAKYLVKGTSSGVYELAERPVVNKPATVADAVEQILAERGDSEISVLLTELSRRYAIKTTKKDLANTLNRWITHRGKRFRRVGPNVFALKAKQEERRPKGRKEREKFSISA